MSKINDKIYILSMIETLINEKNQTDLGDYILEYAHDFSEIGGGDMYDGDACLAIAVRLRKKNSNLIEWGNIYNKRLIPSSSTVDNAYKKVNFKTKK